MSDQAFHFCILFSLIYIERLGCVRGPQIQEGAQSDTAYDTEKRPGQEQPSSLSPARPPTDLVSQWLAWSGIGPPFQEAVTGG